MASRWATGVTYPSIPDRARTATAGSGGRPTPHAPPPPRAGGRPPAVARPPNPGRAPSGVFNVKWFLDGAQVGYGSHASLAPRQGSSGNVRFHRTPRRRG